LRISEDIIAQYIISNVYEKPKIEVGNYYLKWNEKSYGISQREINELKGFLIKVIPSFDIIYQLINSLERPKGKEKASTNKDIFPDIHISHRNKKFRVIYDLYMLSDGATFIERTEKLEIISKDYNKISKSHNVPKYSYNDLELYLKSKLGQLLFNRQGRTRVK
jgi:hypothetical protein